MSISPCRAHRSVLAVTLLTLLATALAGCAAREVKLSPAELRMNELLDTVRRGAEPEEIKACLSTRAYSNVEIVDNTRLIFSTRNGRAWVNELRASCAGLRRTQTLVFDLRGSSVCEMDRVRGVVPGLQGLQDVRAMCVLGKFYRIPDYQVPAISETLDAL